MTSTSRTVEHVGEWRVELRAASLSELFVEMARVIARAAGTRGRSRSPWEDIDVEARDLTSLLVDYANELLSRSEVERRAYDEVREIVIDEDEPSRIRARIRGRPVTSWRSPLKAATYHGAYVRNDNGEWHAGVLFDV